MNQENEIHKIAKIKIRPLKYTLMELREINYYKRRGKPIPVELLSKHFEDFDVRNQLLQGQKPKQTKLNINNSKIDEIKEEDNKESSSVSNSQKSNSFYKNENNNGSSKKRGILKLNFNDDEDEKDSSDNSSNMSGEDKKNNSDKPQ